MTKCFVEGRSILVSHSRKNACVKTESALPFSGKMEKRFEFLMLGMDSNASGHGQAEFYPFGYSQNTRMMRVSDLCLQALRTTVCYGSF